MVQLSQCDMLVYKFACVDSTSCPVFRLSKSGTKHLSAVTVATLMVRGVGNSAEAEEGRETERWPVGKYNKMREDKRRDGEMTREKHVGHFTTVQKGLIYPPPLSPPHGHRANFNSATRQHRLCQDKSRSDCQSCCCRQELVIVG